MVGVRIAQREVITRLLRNDILGMPKRRVGDKAPILVLTALLDSPVAFVVFHVLFVWLHIAAHKLTLMG